MKLLTYEAGAGPRAGVLVEDRVVDAGELLGASAGLRDVQALLELEDDPLGRLRAARAGASAPDHPRLLRVPGARQRGRHAPALRRLVPAADLLLLEHAAHLRD